MWQAIVDFFAPLFTTFSIITFGGAAICAAIALLIPAPFVSIKRYAFIGCAGFLLVYFVGIHNYNLGAADMKAKWEEANRTAAIVYAERDAENYNKTREEKERILADVDRERANFQKEIDRLVEDRKKIPPECRRIPDATLERLRGLARNPAAGR